MHAIVTTQGKRRWISGLFRSLPDARAQLALAAADPSLTHELRELAFASFPIFALEHRDGLEFLDAASVVARLRHVSEPAEGTEPILTAFTCDFVPSVPARDEMGRLPHVHLDGDGLARVLAAGPAGLLLLASS